MAVTHFQCPEYLFEHVDPVADAGVYPRFDLYRACALPGEMGGQLSFKMNPVDRPRVLLVGPVGMRFPGRQDEILVGGHLEFLPFRPEPARSFYAIDEDELRDRLLPFPEMMPRFRVISDIGNVQNGGNRVFLHLVDDGLWKDKRPLPAETVFSSDHNMSI